MAVKKGASLIELLVVVAVIVFCLSGLLFQLSFSLKKTVENRHLTQANFLARGAIESVRNFRDNTDWASNGLGVFVIGNDYHLQAVGVPKEWQFVGGASTTDIFTWKVQLFGVFRDVNNYVVDSGGVLDTESKKVKATITWVEMGETKELTLDSILTNWR